MLTGVIELDICILLLLSKSSLGSLFQTNSYFQTFSKNEYFWRLKVERDFPLNPSFIDQPITFYKPTWSTHLEQYQYLCQPRLKNESRADSLLLCLTQMENLYPVLANLAFYGHIQPLQQLKKKGVFLNVILHSAVAGGQLHILKWLHEEGTPFCTCVANEAVSNGYVDITKYCCELGIYPNQNAVNTAVMLENFEVLDWLATKEIFPSQTAADNAIARRNTDAIKWLIDKDIYPSFEAILVLVRRCAYDLLHTLTQKNVLPADTVMFSSAKYGCLEVLEWAIIGNKMPTSAHADIAMQYGHLHILDRLYQMLILPSASAIKNNVNQRSQKWLLLKRLTV